MSAGHRGDDALKWPIPTLFAWAAIAAKSRDKERLEEASDARNAYHGDKSGWKAFVKALTPSKLRRNG